MKKFRTARIALVCVILIITSLPLRANADLSAILLVDGSNTVTTEEFSLTVQIEGEDMRGGAARLMYDPAQLRVVSVTSRESEDISVRHSEENGVVSFLFTTVEKMSGTLDLLDVVFAVIDGQEGETVTIDMIDRTASDGEREVVPLYTQFITVLAATMHTETPGIQTETTVPETTAPETTTAEPETEPEPTVVRHKQEGKHMVKAGGLTISVPTTFEGLEMEGAEFSGDDVIVRAGQKGSCRMKYRGAFNSIRINVTNNTDYDMAVRECTIWGIEVASQEPDPELSLYGITMGATRQEIADVYGEPFSKTFDDENHMSNMVYQFGEDIHSNQIVMIIFKDKKAVAASYDDFDLVVR